MFTAGALLMGMIHARCGRASDRLLADLISPTLTGAFAWRIRYPEAASAPEFGTEVSRYEAGWLGPWAIGICVFLLLTLAGCADQRDLRYAASDSARELPQRHRDTLTEDLARLFGTPWQPRLRIAKESVEEPDGQESTSPELVDVGNEDRLQRGAAAYRQRCSGCHGITGDGHGPAAAYLVPRPRDYRRGVFKFTSTPIGSKPTRADLVRTVRRGARGTSMPGFPHMPDDELEAVLDYVILLSQRGEVEARVAEIAAIDYDESQELPFSEFTLALTETRANWDEAKARVLSPVTPRPPYTRESILAGRRIFLAENCAKCHGEKAKGQTDWLSPEFLAGLERQPEGQRILLNYDAWKQVAPAADLTARMLHGGRRPIDIYRRIHAGINGTPMPSFATTFAKEPDNVWHLVHYVLSIVEGGAADPEQQEMATTPDKADGQ